MEAKKKFIAIACFEIAIFGGGYGAGIMFPDSPAYIWFGIAIFFAILGCIIWPKSRGRQSAAFQEEERSPSQVWEDIFPKHERRMIGHLLPMVTLILILLLAGAIGKTLWVYTKTIGG